MTPSSAPPFSVAGVAFRCVIVDDGANELGLISQRFEWRSADGRLAVWRGSFETLRSYDGQPVLVRRYHAAVDGEALRDRHPTLAAAMLAAVRAISKRGKAA